MELRNISYTHRAQKIWWFYCVYTDTMKGLKFEAWQLRGVSPQVSVFSPMVAKYGFSEYSEFFFQNAYCIEISLWFFYSLWSILYYWWFKKYGGIKLTIFTIKYHEIPQASTIWDPYTVTRKSFEHIANCRIFQILHDRWLSNLVRILKYYRGFHR